MKRKKLNILKDYLLIYIGTLIAAFSINAFLVPSNLAPGGATGLSILINYLTKIPVSTLLFIINIPIILIGIKIFGKLYGLKTLIGITFLSFNVGMLKDKIPDIDKVIDFTNPGNILLATLYGGVLIGTGLGIVIRNGGTTGGTDVLSGILNKYLKIPIGQGLIMIDSTVILFAAYLFGAEKALYSIINLYVTGIVINKIINGSGNAKMAYIITSEFEKVRKIIVEDLGKTGNYYAAQALYTQNKKDVITTVLRSREIYLLKELISEVDKEAFLVVSDVHDVMGRGYTFDFHAAKRAKKSLKEMKEVK